MRTPTIVAIALLLPACATPTQWLTENYQFVVLAILTAIPAIQVLGKKFLDIVSLLRGENYDGLREQKRICQVSAFPSPDNWRPFNDPMCASHTFSEHGNVLPWSNKDQERYKGQRLRFISKDRSMWPSWYLESEKTYTQYKSKDGKMFFLVEDELKGQSSSKKGLK